MIALFVFGYFCAIILLVLGLRRLAEMFSL
jgi:hypothetical protein